MPFLDPVQFSSAEFSNKEEIIAPVITVWERFSVAKNQQMSKHPSSLQPVSCSSYALNWEPCGQLIKGFHTCDYTIYTVCFGGHARESLYEYECKEVQLFSLLLSFSGPLSHPVSALCLLHLITSQCLTTVREGNHEEHRSLICLTRRVLVWSVCVCVCAYTWETMNQSKRKREERGD